MADLSDINSMVLNKLRLAERQRTKLKKEKKLLSFLTKNRRTTFVTHHRGADERDRKQDRDLTEGGTTC